MEYVDISLRVCNWKWYSVPICMNMQHTVTNQYSIIKNLGLSDKGVLTNVEYHFWYTALFWSLNENICLWKNYLNKNDLRLKTLYKNSSNVRINGFRLDYRDVSLITLIL